MNKFEMALRDVLPLAEAYLKDAPAHPDQAKLETARALLNEPSTGESPTASRQRGEGSPLTAKEKAVTRRAISNLLSSEYDDPPEDIAALERALEKLQ